MSDWKNQLHDVKKKLHQEREAPARHSPQHEPRTLKPDDTSRQPRARRHVCLGLDFGTSSTKAVIQLLPIGPARGVDPGAHARWMTRLLSLLRHTRILG